MQRSEQKLLLGLHLAYTVATLVHFVHNAEFIKAYPNLPQTWTRVHVYRAWIGITAVGVLGWFVLKRGYRVGGLLLLAVYAVFGLDGLGHCFLAPLSAHTATMNGTILVEVTAAVLVLVEVVRQLLRRSDLVALSSGQP